MKQLYAKTTLTIEQMRRIESLGRDCSDASLYINDITEDGIDNGQLYTNLHPNDGSRQEEINHEHIIYIYSNEDLQRIVPKSNLTVRQYSGFIHGSYRSQESEPDLTFETKGSSLTKIYYDVICFCLENNLRLN